MDRKTRFVRIKLEYVVDIGREVTALPPEFQALTQNVNGLICHGLLKALQNALSGALDPPPIQLQRGAHYTIGVCYPKEENDDESSRLRKPRRAGQASTRASKTGGRKTPA